MRKMDYRLSDCDTTDGLLVLDNLFTDNDNHLPSLEELEQLALREFKQTIMNNGLITAVRVG